MASVLKVDKITDRLGAGEVDLPLGIGEGAAWDTDGTPAWIANTLTNAAIIEKGSNANGRYVKFADGTQICVQEDTTATQITTAEGSVYRTASESWTYPAAFLSAATTTLTGIAKDAVYSWFGSGGASSTNSIGYYSIMRGGSLGAVVLVGLLAVGRWK